MINQIAQKLSRNHLIYLYDVHIVVPGELFVPFPVFLFTAGDCEVPGASEADAVNDTGNTG